MTTPASTSAHKPSAYGWTPSSLADAAENESRIALCVERRIIAGDDTIHSHLCGQTPYLEQRLQALQFEHAKLYGTATGAYDYGTSTSIEKMRSTIARIYEACKLQKPS